MVYGKYFKTYYLKPHRTLVSICKILLQCLRFYCEDGVTVLYEEWFHCTDLGTQLVPIITRYVKRISTHDMQHIGCDHLTDIKNLKNSRQENQVLLMQSMTVLMFYSCSLFIDKHAMSKELPLKIDVNTEVDHPVLLKQVRHVEGSRSVQKRNKHQTTTDSSSTT